MHPEVDGRHLNAEYSVEREGDHLAVVLESAGGRTAAGIARNTDYNRALALLITRLGERDAVLLDALVDSQVTRRLGLSEDERRVMAGPVELSAYRDSEGLRRRLTSPQGVIGQSAGAGKAGNTSKRLRLRVSVPGYGADDAERLAQDLARAVPAAGADEESSPPAERSLPGEDRSGESGTAETVLSAVKQLDLHGSPDGPASGQQPLVSLREEPLGGTFHGTLSRSAVVARRGEQEDLRRLLIRGGQAACALCGLELPENLLVAAHIKRRSECTEAERRDLDNIAMPACTLGCDALYEQGYVAVSADGTVLLSRAVEEHPVLHDHASHRRLLGRKTDHWNSEREPYFAWHRSHVYRG
jgi:hypothetical protein